MMQRLILLFAFSACSYLVTGQIIDDFSDQDFANNPSWTGTDADFTVNTSHQIQTNTSVAATSYLATPHLLNSLDDKEWKFYVRMNFAGSATNFARIYLTADQANLTLVQNGYYIQLGEAGSNDAVRLFKLVNGVSTQLLASTTASIVNSANLGVQIKYAASGDWTMKIDFSGGQNYQHIGSFHEVATLIGTHFGLLTTYTTSNIKKVYLGSVYVGNEILDTIPPSLVTTTIVDAVTVRLTFSEAVEQSSVESLTNYQFSPALNLLSATQSLTQPAEVTLIFDDTFVNGEVVNFTVQQVSDMAMNAQNITGSFQYLYAETPHAGDVIINEMMVDPLPVIGLPEVEFIEIYNRSTKYFNLASWKIGDNATFGTIANTWLAPGEYKVLCASSSVPLFANTVAVTSFPSYNNDTDAIILKDNNGVILDQLNYKINWYQDEIKKLGGYSLERINPMKNCSDQYNWIASNDPLGGTPGLQNSIFSVAPDITAPSLLSTTILTNQQVEIVFSEGLDSLQALTSHYNFSPNLTIASRSVAGQYPDKVQLTFVESFVSGQLYTYSIFNVMDCSGNSTNLNGQFLFLTSETPVLGDLIINEMMVDPSPVIGLPEVEFVEIYNRSAKYFNLSGWKLGDNATFGTITNAWIAPGEYKVLCSSSSVSLLPHSIAVTSLPSFNNDTDAIILKDTSGVIIDQLVYQLNWYQDDVKKLGGYTLERKNPLLACSSAANWSASMNDGGGTPGFQNSVFSAEPDVLAPQFTFAMIVDAQTIACYFSEGLDSLSIMNAQFSIVPPLNLVQREVVEKFPSMVFLHFSDTIAASTLYHFSFENGSDCSGNLADIHGSFIRPDAIFSGDLVINEILFNPKTGGADFVEVKNVSQKMIDVKGLTISNTKLTSTSTQTIGISKIIPANGLFVLTADTLFLQQNYPFSSVGNYVKMTLPSFSNDSSTVMIAKDSTFLDKVSYSTKWHFKLIDDVKGKSLERIDPTKPSNQADNWHTAAEAVGFATPGIENSQYSPSLASGEFSLGSETFSPDNDGFEDFLQINYEMIENGMLANVTIFDDRGRIMRKLVKNELLGVKGFFVWDGLTDGELKASVGTYVVLFEAFNATNGHKFFKKKVCVLAGKL